VGERGRPGAGELWMWFAWPTGLGWRKGWVGRSRGESWADREGRREFGLTEGRREKTE
jgi:hypothetical protein